ncbi:MAG: precorrin-2 dehydrogenase/sirohydrochlorin ferrochelatase family protein [Candidatus Dormibacteria bacterium]
MGYYATYLDLTGRHCLVVGGGLPALERAHGLVTAGATVSVAATDYVAGFRDLAVGHDVTLLHRAFEAADLERCALVLDASGDDVSGVEVAREARARGVLVNVVDRVPLCDFIAPALVRRGPLQLAISTAGRSPFMASYIRSLVERWFTPEWGEMVEMVGILRDRLRSEGVPAAEQQRIYAMVPRCGALGHLRRGDREAARQALEKCAERETPG